ncbi:MAG: MMPL family transporter [Acidimicrobiia bacterium]|nr:MMPL family transporter [Acidimicrobiia bacterium]
MYRSLGQWCFRQWKLVIGVWVLALVGVTIVAQAVGPAFDTTFEIPASESRDGFDVLNEHFGGQGSGNPGSIVFRTTPDLGVANPDVERLMTELFDYTTTLDPGLQLTSPYSENLPRPQVAQVGPQAGNIAFASLNLSLDIDQVEGSKIGREISDKADELLTEAGLADKVQVELGGAYLAGFEPPQTEAIGLGFAVIVLILAFGSVMAMGLPIGVAVAGVGTGIGIVNLLTNILPMPDFATTVGAMIGLGVGIDYALFIVTRYRSAMAAGRSPDDAVGLAMDTAGRAVVFAGLTVVVSLLGMLLIGLKFISGLGVGAASTVAVTMLASVTLLPALLGLVGHRVELSRVRGVVAAGLVAVGLFTVGIGVALVGGIAFLLAGVVLLAGTFIPVLKRQVPHRPEKPLRETVPYRWSRMIQGHPWVALVAGAAVLLVLASPVLGLNMGFSDEGNFPEDTTTRKAYDLIAEGFGPGFNGPFLVTAVPTSADGPASLEGLQRAIADTEGVATASAPIPDNVQDPAAAEAFLIQVIPTTSPQDEATEDLVKHLREDVIPASSVGLDVNVTGAVPSGIDFTTFLGARILLFFGVVLALSFLLLMAVFRSVVVPLKAVIMNVLSIAASYGVVVVIFQWGWGGQFLNIAGAPIEPFIPMMLFAIVFGLSMDYEVFLLSRVKEEYERTGDARNSVADGLASTARVISAAAAIMIVVFGSFMFESNRIIKLFGLGLSLAVLLDASLVRLLLVPATMELLGARNWWLPRWLDRILPNLNIEGTEAAGHATAEDGARQPEPVLD